MFFNGPNTGNTALTITGTGFQTGATVKVADVACSSVSVVSATSITCTTAGKAATCGPTAVTVTNPDLQTASSSRYSYASKSFAFGTSKTIPNGASNRGAVWAELNSVYTLSPTSAHSRRERQLVVSRWRASRRV